MAEHAALRRALAVSHGIDVAAVFRRRTVLGIITKDADSFIWKPMGTRDDEKRLHALAGLAELFDEAGTEAALPLPTHDGSILIRCSSGGEKTGYLQKWLPGRHIDVQHTDERLAVMDSLARVHLASQQLDFPGWETLQRGTLLHKLRMKERALQRIWPTVEDAHPPLLEWRNVLAQQVTATIHKYSTYLAENRHDWHRDVALCHRDLAPHNMLLQPNGNIAWIDFDHANYDDSLHDVMQFISHSLFLARLSEQDICDLMDTYASAAALPTIRREVLWSLVFWPDILIRTLVDWYRSGCPDEGKSRVRYALECEIRKHRICRQMGIFRERLNA
jgi:Ser/Thr protein kinase RdoA (MazF antagonist)